MPGLGGKGDALEDLATVVVGEVHVAELDPAGDLRLAAFHRGILGGRLEYLVDTPRLTVALPISARIRPSDEPARGAYPPR